MADGYTFAGTPEPTNASNAMQAAIGFVGTKMSQFDTLSREYNAQLTAALGRLADIKVDNVGSAPKFVAPIFNPLDMVSNLEWLTNKLLTFRLRLSLLFNNR